MKSQRKILLLLAIFFLASCGEVLKTPEVNTSTESYKSEFARQKKSLANYKKVNGDKLKVKNKFNATYKYQAYLARNSDKILFANRDLCKYKMYTNGLYVNYTDKLGSPKKYKKYPKVINSTKGFPSQNAGIRFGDIVLRVNGKDISHAIEDKDSDALQKFLEVLDTNPKNTVEVYRPSQGIIRTYHLNARVTCQMKVMLDSDDELNAYADGTEVVIYKRIIDFLYKDDYIFAVLAHEMSHNIMAHIDRSVENETTGALLGALVGIVAIVVTKDAIYSGVVDDLSNVGRLASIQYSSVFEKEADYLSVYILSRSNYSINHVADTWRKMTFSFDNADSLKKSSLTHPAPLDRFVALSAAVSEVKAKIKSKQPLIPEFASSNFVEIKSRQEYIYEDLKL